MNLITAKYETFDVEKQLVVNVFRVDEKIIAKYTFDFSNPENDKVEGSLGEYFLTMGIEWEEEKQKRFIQIKREEAKYYLGLFSE